ncbi:hypothetical protein DERP_000133 [Dermatophagoides pteronyssinus]|uniref:Uncharacterized protein n=1 Tax=Dermatophagoides pteronyssinus TaxID=6956 RepID=A0ABQ8IZA2_DERPT|nr:hypothetical protein DERP_000133 [Dermatophagoides pteronyssinus]
MINLTEFLLFLFVSDILSARTQTKKKENKYHEILTNENIFFGVSWKKRKKENSVIHVVLHGCSNS